MSDDKLRIELLESKIENIKVEGNKMTLQFKSLPVVLIKDEMGIDYDDQGHTQGKIEILNPEVTGKPSKGAVEDGYIQQGEALYEKMPLNHTYQNPCLIFLVQDNGNNIIQGNEIKIVVERK